MRFLATDLERELAAAEQRAKRAMKLAMESEDREQRLATQMLRAEKKRDNAEAAIAAAEQRAEQLQRPMVMVPRADYDQLSHTLTQTSVWLSELMDASPDRALELIEIEKRRDRLGQMFDVTLPMLAAVPQADKTDALAAQPKDGNA